MLLIKIKKTKKRFRAYPTHQAVQTTGSTASNSVIGLNASFEAYSPEKAAEYVSFFENYVRDCLMHFTLCNYIIYGFNDTTTAMSKVENQIIEAQFQPQQNSKKGKILKPFSRITPIRQNGNPPSVICSEGRVAFSITCNPVGWHRIDFGRPSQVACPA